MKNLFRKPLLAIAITALASTATWSASHEPAMTDEQKSAGETSMESQTQPGPTSTARKGNKAGGPDTVAINPLLRSTPDELEGRAVIGATDQDLGKITQIVSDKGGRQMYAVISTGGFLGIGSTEYVVPLDDLRVEGELIHLNSTQEQLSAKPRYNEQEFLVVQPNDQPISEFSAFEALKN